MECNLVVSITAMFLNRERRMKLKNFREKKGQITVRACVMIMLINVYYTNSGFRLA